MTGDKRLGRLQDIAGLMAEEALQPVNRATATVRRIEARIADIAAHRERLMRAANTPDMAGPLLQQANRLRLMQADALTELAQAKVVLERARLAAAKAVGRQKALDRLEKRQRIAAKQAAERKRLLGHG